MNILLVFFAIPLAVIILSAILETFIHCPIKVAGIFFSIFIVVAFALGGDAILIVAAIIYTLLAFIAAAIVRLIINRICNRCNDECENRCGFCRDECSSCNSSNIFCDNNGVSNTLRNFNDLNNLNNFSNFNTLNNLNSLSGNNFTDTGTVNSLSRDNQNFNNNNSICRRGR